MPGMKSRDMLEELRMVSRNLELETEDFCSVDSANIFPEDWASLAELIAKRSREYHGITVIHEQIQWHIRLLCWHLCFRIFQFLWW